MILIIETSVQICSVALAQSDGTLKEMMASDTPNAHAEKLPAMVRELLLNHRIQAHELEAVGVNKGPGSYTGLRIGTSLAKGICFATAIPLIALNGFQGIAWEAKQQDYSGEIYLANLDARRDEFYLEVFNNELAVSAALRSVIAEPDFLETYGDQQIVVCGNASEKIKNLCNWNNNTRFFQLEPGAAFLCNEAAYRFNAGIFEDVAYFEPRYLKDFLPGVSRKFIT